MIDSSLLMTDNSIRSGVGVEESKVFKRMRIDNFRFASIELFSTKSVFKMLFPA